MNIYLLLLQGWQRRSKMHLKESSKKNHFTFYKVIFQVINVIFIFKQFFVKTSWQLYKAVNLWYSILSLTTSFNYGDCIAMKYKQRFCSSVPSVNKTRLNLIISVGGILAKKLLLFYICIQSYEIFAKNLTNIEKSASEINNKLLEIGYFLSRCKWKCEKC